MAMTLQYPNITLGTAGHVDHGKTALIKLLTGCDTDRLKEEKERGMSIDLGYAPCTLGGMQVGIVDVPGHENFVKTMVSGASGMDGFILVVAADDGVMPQTREHLDILTLLGVEHGLVALTKIDCVGEDDLKIVHDEVRDFLRGTFLKDAPILPICSLTGEGFEGIYEALADMVQSIQPRSADGVFRLPVDRAFSATGYGTIVAGIPVSGSARNGDEVVLLPQGLEGRIRGIEVYQRQADTVLAGQCAALNVSQWDYRIIKRGDTVTLAGWFEPHQWYLCRLKMLSAPRVLLKSGERVRFHTGTSEVVAAVYLMHGNELHGAQECVAQVRTERPLVAAPRDRFIVRSLSPARTIGGGVIVEGIPRRLKRTRPGLLEDLEARVRAVRSDRDFVEYCIKDAGAHGAREVALGFRAKVPQKRLQQILGELLDEEKVALLAPGFYIHAESAVHTKERLLEIVRDFHRASPHSPGITREGLQEAAGVSPVLVAQLVEMLAKTGRLENRGDRLALPEHRVTFQEEDEAYLKSLESVFRESGFHPPNPQVAIESRAAPTDKAEWALQILLEHGHLVRVADNLVFHRDAVERAREILVEFIRKEGKLESVRFKYLLDTTRKFAIPLLDYFDRIGVTSRVGHTRYLKQS